MDGMGAGVWGAAVPDYYFVQTFAAGGPDYRVPRPFREDRAAAAPGTDGSWNGHEGADLVGGIPGCAALRRHWRYDSHFVDPQTGRRSARGSLCRLRTLAGARAAFVFTQRDGVPRLPTNN